MFSLFFSLIEIESHFSTTGNLLTYLINSEHGLGLYIHFLTYYCTSDPNASCIIAKINNINIIYISDVQAKLTAKFYLNWSNRFLRESGTSIRPLKRFSKNFSITELKNWSIKFFFQSEPVLSQLLSLVRSTNAYK